MTWPIDDRKFPGVSVTSSNRMADRGIDFRANFMASAVVVAASEEVEKVAAIAGRGALGDMGARMAHIAANAVMRAVALIVLRRVRRDWGGFFGIGMEIIDRGEMLDGQTKRGRATKIDYRARQLSVAWNFNLDGPTEQQIAFDDALDKFQRHDWDLP